MKNLHNALKLKHLYILKNLGYSYTDIKPSQLEEEKAALPEDLASLKQITLGCHLCNLSKSRQNVVFGDGNKNADIIFVGDIPSAAEDSTGNPFVGRSGEILTKMIENVLLIPRDKVYISNIIKCRPPSSRAATQAEVLTCRAFFQKQIELIKPRFIVTLGIESYRYLTDDNSAMSEIQGTIVQGDSYRIIPTLHPNYLLRNPSAKKEVLGDLLKLKGLMEN